MLQYALYEAKTTTFWHVLEVVAQGLWKGAVEAAYDLWGWIGGVAALVAPFVAVGFTLWIIFR